MNRVTEEQAMKAKEAIGLIEAFCNHVSLEDCKDGECPIWYWCIKERDKFIPANWEVE